MYLFLWSILIILTDYKRNKAFSLTEPPHSDPCEAGVDCGEAEQEAEGHLEAGGGRSDWGMVGWAPPGRGCLCMQDLPGVETLSGPEVVHWSSELWWWPRVRCVLPRGVPSLVTNCRNSSNCCSVISTGVFTTVHWQMYMSVCLMSHTSNWCSIQLKWRPNG